MSYIFDVARGRIPGHTIDTKFGRNPDIDTTGFPEDVWEGGGVYTGQPDHDNSAETVEIFSGSANDTAAGTGAQTVLIQGLDENWDAASETLTMSGATPVTSSNSYHRVFRATVNRSGSTGNNEGVITVRHTTTTANVFVNMLVNSGQSNICAFTVPRNKTVYIVRYQVQISRASGAAGSLDYTLRVRSTNGTSVAKRYNTITTGYPDIVDPEGAIVVGEKNDIFIRVEDCSDTNTIVSANIEYITAVP